MKQFHRRFATGTALVTLFSLAAPAAYAQSAADTATATAPQDQTQGGIAEIVVTAQRRSESVQKIPIAVSVLSSADLGTRGINSVADLSGSVPSLNISTEGPQMYTLRGVGTSNTSVNQEQSVALYIDGVYLYNPWATNFPVNAIERTEVLYGPQGTLFGRNTTGGVIQFITRDPTKEKIEANLGYANYNTITGQLYAAGHVAENLSASVAIDYRHQGHGWGYNDALPNNKFNYMNYLSAQGKVVFEPTDTTKITGLFWYNHAKSSGLNAQIIDGTVGVDGVPRHLGRYQYVSDTEDSDSAKSYLGYIRLDQDLGFAQFVSISSYRKVNDLFRLDQDTVPLRVVDATLIQPSRNFSQEFQLLSPDSGSKFKWLVGAYYFWGKAGYRPITIAGFGAAPLPQIEFNQWQRTKSLSGFGQASLEVFDGTTITAGLRYTDEHITQEGFTTSQGVLLFANPDQATDSNGWTGRLAIDQKVSQNLMLYASYNRGLKSGGFSLVTPVNVPPYKKEQIDAYEVGFKSSLLDRRLRFNVAAFWYDFKNIQVQSIVAGGTVTNNAAAARIKGLTADFDAAPVTNLTLNGSFSYLDAKYKSYPGAVYYAPNPFAAPPAGVTCPAGSGSVPAGASVCSFDAKGQTLNFAPKWTATGGITYVIPSEIGDFSLNSFVKYVSHQYSAPGNLAVIPQRTLVNASIGWTSSDKRYGARVWANNLFDKKYLNGVLEEAIGQLQVQGDPRTYGLTLSVTM